MNTPPSTPPKPVLPLIRALAKAYQAFERCAHTQIRESGLTPSQFDVLATLGNTQGMSCKELGERTLITKGTLTGVLDRMEAKGLILRSDQADGRSWCIALTPKGEHLFAQVFPQHVRYLEQKFAGLSSHTIKSLTTALNHFAERI